MRCPDIWWNSILGVPVRLYLDEINMSKADCPSPVWVGLTQSVGSPNTIKKGREMKNSLSLPDCPWGLVVSFPGSQCHPWIDQDGVSMALHWPWGRDYFWSCCLELYLLIELPVCLVGDGSSSAESGVLQSQVYHSSSFSFKRGWLSGSTLPATITSFPLCPVLVLVSLGWPLPPMD